MNRLDISSRKAAESPLPRPHRLIRRLLWLYAAAALALVALLLAAVLPAGVLPQLQSMAQETRASGLAALVLGALLLALTGLGGALALTSARASHAGALPAASSRLRWSFAEPGFAARQGQALIVPVGALLVWLATRLLWPAADLEHDPVAGNIAGAFVLAIAFASLMAERTMAAFPEPQLPEAPMLRRQLLLVTVLLVIAACVQFAHSAQLGWVYWPQRVLLWVTPIVALELALRALARLFLPPPPAFSARAVSDSVVVALLTGGPRAPGTLLRTHFGLDFARSWALGFLSRALMPALVGTALLCWGLSGLKLIDLSHRGIYERFGAPVAVLGPGVHLLLPWPLGRMRLLEYGAIHSVAIGVDSDADELPPPAAALAQVSEAQLNAALAQVAEQNEVPVSQLPELFAAEGIDYGQYREQLRRQLARAATSGNAEEAAAPTPLVSAEATPPLSLNRLWSTVHADQAHYLVASQGTGEQGFQSVSTEIYVLYRVGLTDAAALSSVYTVTDPGALVREAASRLVLRYFNSRTLEEVLGAQRENVEGTLRSQLAADIDSYHAGIDIVSVLIEEIHPPEGAAEAYHAVQAAQINANASISDELGRAKRTAGVAQQEAHELIAAATAQATEIRDGAAARAYRFNADERAYQKDGRAFLIERLLGNFSAALKGKALTIMDHSLGSAQGPIIDMRPPLSAPGAAAAALPTPAPGPGMELEPAFSNAD